MKAVLVSRHELLSIQKKLLEEKGVEIVKKVTTIPTQQEEFKKFVEELKSEGIEAIISTGLPPHIIAQVQKSFTVILAKMEAVATPETEEEAKKIQEEKPELRVIIPGALGERKFFRVMEFRGWFVVKVTIEEKPFAVPN